MKYAKFIGAVILAAILYMIRPLMHGIAMFLYTNPVMVQAGGMIFLGLIAVSYTEAKDGTSWLGPIGVLVILAAALVFIAGVFLSPAYSKVTMSNMVEQEYQSIETLPEVDPQQPRILPRTVAEEYAENSLQTPRYQLGVSDIAITDEGKPQWSMPKSPDGLVNYFRLKQEGAAYVDMTTQSKEISFTQQNMKIGQGMGIRDNLGWNLVKNRYWVHYTDPVNLEHEGNNFIAVPIQGYNFHFKFPIFHTTPEYKGVALLDSSGNIEYLDPEEAREHPVLEDQRLYPYDIARYKVDSMQYKNGIINAWFTHRDQLQVADVPGFGNSQPFTVLTEDMGVQQFVATEPYGNAEGLFEIWLADGQTGELKKYSLNQSGGLLGPGKAMNYVRKDNSRVNWGGGENQRGFEPVEPIPVLLNDKLYWQIRVVPENSAGIAFTSFVNAESGDVVTAETDEQIIEFLESEEVPGGSGPTTPDEDEGSGIESMEIVITADGEVIDRIKIDNPENVSIGNTENVTVGTGDQN